MINYKENISWDKILGYLEKEKETYKDVELRGQDLRMNNKGKIVGLNDKFESFNFNVTKYSRKQLFAKLDMPTRYFDRLYKDDEYRFISPHINKHIKEKYEDSNILIRTIKQEDGLRARAFLSDEYSPFDDHQLMNIVHNKLEGYDYELESYSNNGLYSSLRLTFNNEQDISEEDRQAGDVLKTGLIITNSEVGKSGIRISPMVYRVFCNNGMAVWQSYESTFYKRHRWLKTEEVARWVANAVDEAILLSEEAVGTLQSTKDIKLEGEEPKQKLARLKINKSIQKKIIEEYQDNWLQKGNNTLYGLINSLTSIAKGYQEEERFELETKAYQLMKKAA